MREADGLVVEPALTAEHSRRDVLRYGRWAAVGLGIAGVASAFGVSLFRGDKVVKITRSTFAEHVGTTFAVRSESVRTSARLTQISGLPGHLDAVDEHRFVLVFSGPADIDQNTYTFSHKAIGDHDIFVVPTRDRAGNTVYEAVFNQAPGGVA